MEFEPRKGIPIVFTGEGSTLMKEVVEEGDEAVLFHDGKVVMAKISSCKGDRMIGIVTWSACEPDLHSEFMIGKEIHFLEENIFSISKMKKKV